MRLRLPLVLLALVVLCLPLAACCGEGFTLRSPVTAAEAPPRVVPTQWGVVQQTQAVGVVQTVQPVGNFCAPVAAPVAAPPPMQYYAVPQPMAVPYTSGYQFAAPPTVGDCR